MKRPRQRPPTPALERRWSTARDRAVIAIIVVAGLLVYANGLSNPFVLDDKSAILENPQIRQLWPLSAPLSPPDETPVARRPLVNLTLAINYALGGLDVFGYHLANVAFLVLGALTLFGLVRRTLVLGDLERRFSAHATEVAAACALIWMLHPLHTEVVNYVSQRTSSLMGLFYLLTLYASVRGLAPATSRWRVAATLSCAAGMACKESMVTAPALVVLFDRVFVFGSFRDALRTRRRFYFGLSSTWLMLGALMATGSRTTVGFDAGTSAWTYLLNQIAVVLRYLRLVIWPRGLVVDYGMPRPMDLGDVLWPGLLMGALGIAVLIALKYWPRAGFLGLSAFALLAPTSSIVPIVTEVGAERRMYLPLAAIVVLVVCAAYIAGGAFVRRVAAWLSTPGASCGGPLGRRAAACSVAVVCALLAMGVVLRNREYQSALSLARTTVERRPHGRAQYSLGLATFKEGRRQEALGLFRQAAKDFPGARFALGTELLVEGDLEAGIAELRVFIEHMPRHTTVAGAREMIAIALMAQDRPDAAIEQLQLIIRLQPQSRRAQALLGEALVSAGRAAEAIDPLERALALTPANPRLHTMLGSALAQMGRLSEARVHFQTAVHLDPTYEPARLGLSKATSYLAAAASGSSGG